MSDIKSTNFTIAYVMYITEKTCAYNNHFIILHHNIIT